MLLPSPSTLRRSSPALLLAALAAAGSLASCGGVTTTTGGAGGAGGGGGGGDGGGGGGGAGPLCVPAEVGFQGSIDGEAAYETYPRTATRTAGSIFESFFRTKGTVALFGEGDFTDGVSVGAKGFFRMPVEGPHAGVVFCAGAGSSVQKGPEKRFELASLSRLAGCPGEPVDGQITACLGDASCLAGNALEGTLGGVSFDYGAAIEGWGGFIDVYQVRLSNGGFIALDIELDTVLGGLLMLAPEGPDPGAIYCLGAGSMTPGGPAPNAISFSVGGLSRLGACADAAPVDGALSGCTE